MTGMFRLQHITRRWVLTERRARWLARSVPERERQIVYYENRLLGYSVVIEDHHPISPPPQATADRGA